MQENLVITILVGSEQAILVSNRYLDYLVTKILKYRITASRHIRHRNIKRLPYIVYLESII